MKKLFESTEDQFLDVEKKIKEELTSKGEEKINNMMEEVEKEMCSENSEEDKESVSESDECKDCEEKDAE